MCVSRCDISVCMLIGVKMNVKIGVKIMVSNDVLKRDVLLVCFDSV